MRRSFKILFGIIVFILVAREFYSAFSENNRALDKIGVLSNGTVHKISGGGGRSAVFIDHVVNGKRFSNLMPATPYGLVMWEKYKILYDPNDPKHFMVLIDQPIFLNGEITAKCIAKVTKITSRFTIQPLITFEYCVSNVKGNQTFDRSQYLPDSFEKDNPDIKEGDKFTVEYWLENPKRAIINLNEPLS